MGLLLGDGEVLTCAHVVTAALGCPDGVKTPPAQGIPITFLALAGSPTVTARVIPECWAPAGADGRADIALLKLDAPEIPGARLHRLPPRAGHRVVRAHGVPAKHPDGVWAYARLAGPVGPAGEWVQLDALAGGQLVRRGFSGAAVLDERSEAVVGIVVMAHRDERERLACMIPVTTLEYHLPGLKRWIGKDLPAAARVCVFGTDDLGPGASEVWIDVRGLSVGEVHERIEGRISRDPRPVAVTLAGLDEAERPEELLQSMKGLMQGDNQVAVEFLSDDSPGLRMAQEWLREENTARLAKLTGRIEELQTAEAALRARWLEASHVVSPLPEAPCAAPSLLLRARALDGRGLDTGDARGKLGAIERKTGRAAGRVGPVRTEIDAMLARYRETKGLLRAYNARATDFGLCEDLELSVLHRPAAEAISHRPCAVPQAEILVAAYVEAVRRRIDDLPEGAG
ncbi:serine protease [Amycolatopsis sp. cg5]|uniref:S1 family peptidase n=1 Tax=Amycolatopsis sp. cg5 TaxID=3238802 RepID=UPI00352365CA